MDETLKKINLSNLLLGIVYVTGSLFLKSFSKTLGVLFGTSLMVINFYLMGHLVRRAFSGGRLNPVPALLYILKFGLLILATYLVLKWDYVNKLFFILGTTVILPSLLLQGFLGEPKAEGTEERKQ